MHSATEHDENGDPFEVWLVKRSFGLLAPVCRMGLVVTLVFLCIADPLYFYFDLWSQAIAHGWLLAWHIAIALVFAANVRGHPLAQTHAQRQRFLGAFVCGMGVLFVWFGVVSWLGTGDLSIVAIAQILVAAVFCLPGNLRRWSYGLQALVTALLLVWLDRSGKFLGEMQFANLFVIAAVAGVMDGYMQRNALTLFAEKCSVVRERQRADAVLYNALPPKIAEELKTHHQVKAQSHAATAILFADIVGFTEFAANHSAEHVLNTLNGLFSEMDTLVDIHQVEKIKTIGDAYMAVSHTDPRALAKVALAMLKTMRRFNAERGLNLALRVGLHSGPTIAGVIGHKGFLYDLWGDAVNIASRMESAGVPGCIHASQALFFTLRQGFEFEARGLVHLKGKGLLPTYFLLAEKDQSQGLQDA